MIYSVTKKVGEPDSENSKKKGRTGVEIQHTETIDVATAAYQRHRLHLHSWEPWTPGVFSVTSVKDVPSLFETPKHN